MPDGRRSFRTLLERHWRAGRSLCVGLDPEWDRLPTSLRGGDAEPEARARAAAAFCTAIVGATHDLVCAFKPNAAFFEAFGPAGARALGEVVAAIRAVAPDVPVIYDAKRGDIGSTNAGYVRDAFHRLGADAVTVHPYLGEEALRPFLDRADTGVIVLCRTSNPGAGEFQDLVVAGEAGPAPLYEIVARRVASVWNRNGNCALVVGATYPRELARVRAIVGDLPILVPGIGAQGGDLDATLAAGLTAAGSGLILSASRSVLYASAGYDYAAAARREVLALAAVVERHRRERAA